MPADAIFAPFLYVISSQSTTGSITFISLSAITKFLDYKIIHKESLGIQLAISELAAAITHCRFEATDQAEDDAVLLKILSLMEEIVCGIGGDLLNDESLCDIIETCLSMACQMRRGDLLRRSAEMTMIKLTQAVFTRVSELEPEVVIDAKSVETSEIQMSEPNPEMHDTSSEEKTSHEFIQVAETAGEDNLHEHTNKPFERYGLASLREYFRVLISIIDISNFHQYTDATRIMALHLINVAFEVSGKEITKHESLLNLTTNTLLKHILQLIRAENPFLLQKALRVFSTILQTTGEHLKLHQEVFLTYLLTCLSPISEIPREEGVDKIFYDGVPSIPRTVLDASPFPSKVGTPVAGSPANLHNIVVPTFVTSRSPDSREMMVEAIASLARIPSFFVDLFVNYDCDVDRADLCEDMIGFLCRNAYPDSTTWSTATVPPLCLEAVLGYLVAVVQRLPGPNPNKELAEEVMRNKALKKLVIEATECFNKNPTEGLQFLVKHKLIEDDTTASKVKFLQKSGRINKKLLGEFLAKPKNKEYLDLFIENFDFSNTSLDEAMRSLFAAFRLPGEAQQIERIMEKFAAHYVSGENNVKHVVDADAAFVLSYAVILLNTDLHNPQVKKHMTNEEFKRNLRKVNGGHDFSPEYLDNIYYTIKQREIIVPEEHNNEESFEHAWKEVLLKSSQTGRLKIVTDNTYDKDMFQSTWHPVVTMLAYVFATATEDAVFSRVITGFDHVAKIASHYNIPGVLDQITSTLCKISTLSFGELTVPSSTTQIQIEDDKIVVSDLSIQFGQDLKAQLASVVLFRLTKANVSMINDAWKDLVPVVTNLYLHSLLDAGFSSKQRKLGVPSLPFASPSNVVQRSKGVKEPSGLFSALSSYLAGYNDIVPEPTDEEVDATLCAVDCINTCSIGEFLNSALSLPSSNMLGLVSAVQQVLPSFTDQSPATIKNLSAATLFLLELVTLAAVEAKDPTVSQKVISILKNYLTQWDIEEESFLTRIMVYYLVTLRHASIELLPELKEALTNISEIKDFVLKPCMPQLVVPLCALADESAWSCDHVLKLKTFWNLHQLAASNRESTVAVFTFVKEIARATNEITSDNLVNVLDILGEVASIGACGAQLEQDKTAIVIEFRKKYDQATAIQKAKEVISSMEADVARAIESLDLIHKLGDVVEDASKDPNTGSHWIDIWFPYVRTLSQQCINPCRAIRQHAFTYYRRIVLSPVAHSRDDFDWVGVFAQALFPLIDALLKPEVYDTDPEGMSRTRLYAAELLCKVFLQYVVRTQQGNSETDEMRDLWFKVLDTLDRLISSTGVGISAKEQNSSLEESVVESVKNMLLVMQSDTKGKNDESTEREKKFWSDTWRRVDVLMPGMKQQLAPDGVDEKEEVKTSLPETVSQEAKVENPPPATEPTEESTENVSEGQELIDSEPKSEEVADSSS